MTLTDALVKSLGPWVIVPSGFFSFLVFRVRKPWSLRSLQVKLIKIEGRLVRHARRLVFQLAEVTVPRELFAAILGRISRLRLAPG